MEIVKRENDDRIDELEAVILNDMPQVECPVKHRFTPGMYIREIFMPAGTLVTSKIHNTCHPYVVSEGAVSVQIDMGEWEVIESPYFGITKPGTRRVLYVHEDTIWTTFHPLNWVTGDEDGLSEEEKLNVVKKIEDGIIEPHINKLAVTKKEQIQ